MSYIDQFDSAVTQFVKSLPPVLAPLMQALTLIGEPIVTIAIIAGIGLYSITQHHTKLLLSAAIAGATFAANSALKILIHRPRPTTYHAEDVLLPTFSFPSGHAASSVIAFGLLAYILYSTLPKPWDTVTAVLLTLLIIGIGISRIYLGAHYPSDVVAGWIVGAIGLAIIIWIVRPL